ncbi:MAG: helix-turn-helix domain-containing protein [Acidobacteriota bacterium]|nr:helix-turn-helix domain-containing protein [Acidobacteriota bacterium]
MKDNRKRERRTVEFKETAVQRIVAGEPVSRLSRELKVKRSLLYRWRDAYRKEGVSGLRPIGCPKGDRVKAEKKLETEVGALQSKVGQQTMMIDFLQRAFRRVAELRRQSISNGVTASTERSRQ